LHYGITACIFFPIFQLATVPSKLEPFDPLLAIATDLLAQAEARQRTARRLEVAARQLSRVARDRRTVERPIDLVRVQVRTLRDLFETERALLDEFERELAGASS
jgi:hypothetical protein